METKYNLLTRLLKNIKNVVNPDGSVVGGGSGVLVVHDVDGALDKTWQEIHESVLAVIMGEYPDGTSGRDIVVQTYVENDAHFVSCASGGGYVTAAASGYPLMLTIDPGNHT